jgi:hypothetical protein
MLSDESPVTWFLVVIRQRYCRVQFVCLLLLALRVNKALDQEIVAQLAHLCSYVPVALCSANEAFKSRDPSVLLVFRLTRIQTTASKTA